MEKAAHLEGAENFATQGARQPLLALNFGTVWVRDQERSLRFFVDQLQFELLVDVEVPGFDRRVIVAPSAPVGFGLMGIAIVAPRDGSHDFKRIGQNTGLSFLTDDVRAVFDAWAQRGVQFPTPPVEPRWGRWRARYALFEDIDGNTFSLMEFDDATRSAETRRREQMAREEAERRTAHDLAIARDVQMRLLPQRRPPMRTLDYAGICSPARVVGGDYYDFLHLGDGRLGLLIGDIAGKGMAAALLMANLQAGLRSQSATAAGETHRFLQSVNQLFFENTAASDYGTLFFADYDDATRLLRFANCGHPAAFLLRRDGSLERLEATATVMGLFEDWDCAVEERQLGSGDTLLLYTDGATEALNPSGEEFGEARLLQELQRNRHLGPQELLAELTEQIRQFSREEQADDITLIAARFR